MQDALLSDLLGSDVPEMPGAANWLRRARPLLGTLVDIGVPVGQGAALDAAFAAIEQVQRRMSRFEAGSDLLRSHAAPAGTPVPVHPWTAEVLAMAAQWHADTDGLFDVALGSGRWQLDQTEHGPVLSRLNAGTRLDLGGIAKGWAVDKAIEAARANGADAVWVNAGGDLRAHGVAVPVSLRDERGGGVQPWAWLEDGAMATSDFTPGARSQLSGTQRAAHISVAAPHCVCADALTKIVALLGGCDHPQVQALLAKHQAQAWIHATPH